MRKNLSLLLVAIFITTFSFAKTYYVAPNGTSGNSGASTVSPMDLKTALNLAVAGDQILCSGGTYKITYVANQKNTITLSKSGTASNPILLKAENGSKATIDFSFPTGAWVQDSYGFELTGSYWYFKNIDITRAGYQGVYVKGKYNTFENCTFYDNRNSGLEINKGGSYTTVLNCDAYRNYDPKKNGSMADGFAPKQTMGPGNKFIGCRAWENSDDGYDTFDSPEIVTFENCWAFNNGKNVFNDANFAGNGNGFKLGGNYAAAKNVVSHCISFGHPMKGFDQNHNMAALTVLNCVSYNNKDNYGIGEATTSGEKHYFRNNISLGSTPSLSNANQSYNSWNTGFSVSSSDFISLNTALASTSRNADGTIPYTDLFRLKPTSALVDAGTDVGLPFSGKAPELGAFEITAQKDCNGTENGTAYLDQCAICVGGTTGKTACTVDCNGVPNGTAFLDNCGSCVSSQSQACSGSVEAEFACHVDGIKLESKNLGFLGEGYVNADNGIGNGAQWILNSNTTQSATISFRYANGGTTSRDGNLLVNGISVGILPLTATGAWTTWKMANVNVPLVQGSNEISLAATTADGLANIDLIAFYTDGISDANCELVTSTLTGKSAEFKAYPNPTNSILYFSEPTDWTLLNNLGLELSSGKSESFINLSPYQKGIYFVVIQGETIKVVKE